MFNRIISLFKTTTRYGKIIREIGTVTGDNVSLEVQKFKKFAYKNMAHIRLSFRYTGSVFGGSQIIISRIDTIEFIRMLEDALSNFSTNDNPRFLDSLDYKLINRIIYWFKTTTFKGKIIKRIGTVYEDREGSNIYKHSIAIQRFKKFGKNEIDEYIRLLGDFPNDHPNQIILSRQEALKLIHLLEGAIS